MGTTYRTTRNGLSTAEADARRADVGPNVLPEPAPPRLAARVGGPAAPSPADVALCAVVAAVPGLVTAVLRRR